MSQLKLSFHYGLLRPQVFHMGLANIGDYPQAGTADCTQLFNFSPGAHSHLQYCPLMMFLHLKNHQRQANGIIVIAPGLKYRILLGEHPRHQFLGSGLAAASRHPQNLNVFKLQPLPGCQALQGSKGIVNLNCHHFSTGGHIPFHQSSYCPFAGALRQIIMAVGMLTSKGHKHTAGHHFSAVDDNGGDFLGKISR